MSRYVTIGTPLGFGASPMGRNMALLSPLAGRLRVAPETEAPGERVPVVPEAAALRQPVQLLAVPAAQHHLVHLESGLEPRDDLEHQPAPVLLADLLERVLAEQVLVGP